MVVENPLTSDIWRQPLLERWTEDNDIYSFRVDLRRFGLMSADGQELLKKPLRLMSTHPLFQEALAGSCEGGHEHRRIEGVETAHSANYPPEFGKAVVKALHMVETQVAYVGQHGPLAAQQEEQAATGTSEDITFKGTVSARVAGAMRRLHQNLGHPSQREMVRHLRMSGAHQDLVDAAQQLRCRTCTKCSQPKSHRVAKPAALMDFNEAVAVDIIFLDTVDATGLLALNMVDIASAYQVVVPLEDRKSSTVSRTFNAHWTSWAGAPGRLVLDLDTAFVDSFWELTSEDNIGLRAAAGQAHWQNGIAERYGSTWKDTWLKLCTEMHITSHELWEARMFCSERCQKYLEDP